MVAIQVVDVTGSLCENNDKFARTVDCQKLVLEIPWLSTTGAHGFSMGYNYTDVFVLQKQEDGTLRRSAVQRR